MKYLSPQSVFALGLFLAGTATCLAGGSVRQVAGVPNFPRVRDLGRVPSAQPITLAVGLRFRNERNLNALITAQSNPNAVIYRHFLTPGQMRDAFAPTPADYNRTLFALRRAGFTITRSYQLRSLIDVVAPAAVVERYFGTSLHRIEVDGSTTYANFAPAYLPSELQSTVSGVTGFTAVALYKPSHVITGAAPTPPPPPPPPPPPQPGFGPGDIAAAFNLPARYGFTGKGVTVADLLDGKFSDTADIAPYLAKFKVKRTGPPSRFIPVNGGCDAPGSFCSFSALIDAQEIIGTAPGVSYLTYVLPNLLSTNIIDGLHAIVESNKADVVNISFAGCETGLGEASFLIDQAFKIGSALGITFEVVSFRGAHPCGLAFPSVQSPADSPYALAVGGADSFVDKSGTIARPPIANQGSGGGYSGLFALPPYQSGIPGVIAGGRNVPDIAGPAAINGIGPLIYSKFSHRFDGLFPFINNAPIAAGLAEVVQLNGHRLGLLNPKLYSDFKRYGYGPANAVLFRDVTLGCNGLDGYGPYCAKPGFDQVSGIGTIDMYNIARRL